MTAKLDGLVNFRGEEFCTHLLPPLNQHTYCHWLVPTAHYLEENTSAYILIECLLYASLLNTLLIFQAKHVDSGWIPPNTPRNWRFPTNDKGWTTN